VAIGFSIGLTGCPSPPSSPSRSFTAALLGLTTGLNVAERTERLAGITLITLGAYLIAEQLTR
jgi:hypothetical protein